MNKRAIARRDRKAREKSFTLARSDSNGVDLAKLSREILPNPSFETRGLRGRDKREARYSSEASQLKGKCIRDNCNYLVSARALRRRAILINSRRGEETLPLPSHG